MHVPSKTKWVQLPQHSIRVSINVYSRGSSSVFCLFVSFTVWPICFFYCLAKLIIFIRSNRIPCIFFLKRDSRAFILEREILPFRMWFHRYEFLKDPPLHFMGEALGTLHNQKFFCLALEYLFIR